MNNRQKGLTLTEMLAYVDENGNLSSTPPEHAMLKQIGKPVNKKQRGPVNSKSSSRTGIVIFFNEAKGFGFIQDEQTKDRIFLHVSDLEDKITDQARVNFEVELGARGLSARKVRLAVN